jgi:hypothetical protein
MTSNSKCDIFQRPAFLKTISTNHMFTWFSDSVKACTYDAEVPGMGEATAKVAEAVDLAELQLQREREGAAVLRLKLRDLHDLLRC